MMRSHVTNHDGIEVPFSLRERLIQEYAQGEGDDLIVDFSQDTMVASLIEGEPENEGFWELVLQRNGQWVELTGDTDPDVFTRDWNRPRAIFFENDNGSNESQPEGVRFEHEHVVTKNPPRSITIVSDPAFTANQKIANRLEELGFFYCRHWPEVLEDHPELHVFQNIAIARGWLDSDGSHPNHVHGFVESESDDGLSGSQPTTHSDIWPKDWETREISDEIPPHPSEPTSSYVQGTTYILKRDRWLYWTRESKRFKWREILREANKRWKIGSSDVGEIETKIADGISDNYEECRTSANRYRNQYKTWFEGQDASS
ncbi:hypothetical protein [Novipirellula artificiosorum]|nr:hypothetical protein [Novipirellula artificiosorum]